MDCLSSQSIEWGNEDKSFTVGVTVDVSKSATDVTVGVSNSSEPKSALLPDVTVGVSNSSEPKSALLPDVTVGVSDVSHLSFSWSPMFGYFLKQKKD